MVGAIISVFCIDIFLVVIADFNIIFIYLRLLLAFKISIKTKSSNNKNQFVVKLSIALPKVWFGNLVTVIQQRLKYSILPLFYTTRSK